MNKNLYVVYWFDLDNDCLKKSKIEIIGIFDNEELAKNAADKYDGRIGYCEDDRCYGVRIENFKMNQQNIII